MDAQLYNLKLIFIPVSIFIILYSLRHDEKFLYRFFATFIPALTLLFLSMDTSKSVFPISILIALTSIINLTGTIKSLKMLIVFISGLYLSLLLNSESVFSLNPVVKSITLLLIYAKKYLLFGIPVFLIWDLITTQIAVKSSLFFDAAVVFIITLYIYSKNEKFWVLSLLGFIFYNTVGFFNSIKEERIVKMKELKIEKEAVLVAKVDPLEILKTKCFACHSFDKRVVGPPFNVVVKKYSNVEDLASFIHSPRKIDPQYPPMPNQGLTKEESIKVAELLMSEVR